MSSKSDPKPNPKLNLERETVRKLDPIAPTDLEIVHGGYSRTSRRTQRHQW
jgi:hypothetical protein